jgi:uncharacterized protein YfaS (alpha-2-macroglobulin family)
MNTVFVYNLARPGENFTEVAMSQRARHTWLAFLAAAAILLIAATGAFPRPASADDKSAILTSVATDNSSYYPGSTVTLTLVARNLGPVKALVRSTAEIVYPSGGTAFSSSTQRSLAAGQTDIYSFSWMVPAASPLGTYSVQGSLFDAADGRFFSSRFAYFLLTTPPPIPKAAALTILGTDKANYNPGDLVAATIGAHNSGGVRLQIRSGVSVTNPNGVVVFTDSKTSRLDPRETGAVVFNVGLPTNTAIGTYQVQGTISDSLNDSQFDVASTSFYVGNTPAAGAPLSPAVVNKPPAATEKLVPGFLSTEVLLYILVGLLALMAVLLTLLLVRRRKKSSS